MGTPSHPTSPRAEGACLEAEDPGGRADLGLLLAPPQALMYSLPFNADGPSWAARQRVHSAPATVVIATLSSLPSPLPLQVWFP